MRHGFVCVCISWDLNSFTDEGSAPSVSLWIVGEVSAC